MEKLNKISKTFLLFTILSFILFTGSYLTKLNLLAQFFDEETMNLKPIYDGNDLSLVLKSLLPSFSVTVITFAAFILFLIVYLVISRVSFKKEGWMFISIVILIVTTPFELFLLFKFDLPIMVELMKEKIAVDYIFNLMKNRITILGPFPLVLLFSYFVIIYLNIFKPLQKY